MTEEIISVIIPVYNMSQYLDACLSSVVNQTYPYLEILLVDDGSKDDSLKKCREWEEKDSRIRVFHKQNGGQGSARNLALDNATGEYIAFVDSDDFVEEDMLEKLMNNLLETDADISCGSVYYQPDKSDFITEAPTQQNNNLESMELFVKNSACINHMPVSKIFRAELFENVRFLELTGYEDAGTIFKAFMKAERIVSKNISLYYYRQREGSTMHRAFSEKDFDRIVAYKEMERGLRENPAYAHAANIVVGSKVGAIYYVVGECMRSNLTGKKRIIEQCKAESRSTLKSGCFLTPKNRFLLTVLCISPKLFELLYKIKH